jgi:hypothetical protein
MRTLLAASVFLAGCLGPATYHKVTEVRPCNPGTSGLLTDSPAYTLVRLDDGRWTQVGCSVAVGDEVRCGDIVGGDCALVALVGKGK